MSSGFLNFSNKKKAATLLCPTSTISAKLANKYIHLLFKVRKLLDEGVPALNFGFESGAVYPNIFFDNNDVETYG